MQTNLAERVKSLYLLLERLTSAKFYGKVEITYEQGQPLIVKETRTHKLDGPKRP